MQAFSPCFIQGLGIIVPARAEPVHLAVLLLKGILHDAEDFCRNVEVQFSSNSLQLRFTTEFQIQESGPFSHLGRTLLSATQKTRCDRATPFCRSGSRERPSVYMSLFLYSEGPSKVGTDNTSPYPNKSPTTITQPYKHT